MSVCKPPPTGLKSPHRRPARGGIWRPARAAALVAGVAGVAAWLAGGGAATAGVASTAGAPASSPTSNLAWLVGRWVRPHQAGHMELTWTAVGGGVRGVVFDLQRGQSRRTVTVYELRRHNGQWTLWLEEGRERYAFPRLFADGQHLRFERRGHAGPIAVDISIVDGKLFVGHAAGLRPSPVAPRDLWFERAPAE